MSFRRTMMQSNYDSVLEPASAGRPAKLTIRLKVALYPLDPAANWTAGGPPPPPTHLADSLAHAHHGLVLDANNSLVACRSWMTPEWNAFKIRFKQVVEHAWNNQMILLPDEAGGSGGVLSDEDFRQLVSNPRVPAHVECALDVELLPMGAASHALIEVAHLQTPGTKFRNWMVRMHDESVQFASHPDARWPSAFVGQITAAHEIGHWLKFLNSQYLPHIDAAYANAHPSSNPAKDQYGHSLGKRMGLMGAGSVATEYEAEPWLLAIRRHTGLLFGWNYAHRINFENAQDISAHQRRLTGLN